jgi:hypothetical protein
MHEAITHKRVASQRTFSAVLLGSHNDKQFCAPLSFLLAWIWFAHDCRHEKLQMRQKVRIYSAHALRTRPERDATTQRRHVNSPGYLHRHAYILTPPAYVQRGHEAKHVSKQSDVCRRPAIALRCTAFMSTMVKPEDYKIAYRGIYNVAHLHNAVSHAFCSPFASFLASISS